MEAHGINRRRMVRLFLNSLKPQPSSIKTRRQKHPRTTTRKRTLFVFNNFLRSKSCAQDSCPADLPAPWRSWVRGNVRIREARGRETSSFLLLRRLAFSLARKIPAQQASQDSKVQRPKSLCSSPCIKPGSVSHRPKRAIGRELYVLNSVQEMGCALLPF